ncbi:serine/threonine-protein kinase [Microbacterium paraoxydans]|jgi:tRNA A-37 threonylcarbamoyl transferase component Bud32|uniref:serine/threonine-protein kinase n=1 Tax=Microbacterium TaxID=33882 RepID=UPI000D01DAB8|nr:serine/threonine-protein kinase [Microbacterium sp. str. 'China']AVL98144.1 serine/threonine protein kinase [Microbacterium sp. str. 'China']
MTDDSLPTEALLDGRYHLRECVGQGGMARVYRAEDSLLGRTVAIKMLRAETEQGAASERARGEMTVLASLNHPALVTLYDAQLHPGRAEYLVMEFVDGPTLAERIAQGPLPSDEVAALAADLAEALHVVHGAGIVHRDIKPSNVLLTGRSLTGSRSGAKLADFGISVLVDAARLTSPGTVIGTAAYLAPEQLNGAAPAPPADIYALGLVLREALTGERAFAEAEGIGATLARLIEAPVIPESVGPAWSALLQRMTATDPEDRPTAAGVFAAVSALAHHPSIPPRPPLPAAIAAAALAEREAAGPSAPTRTLVLPTPPSPEVGMLRPRTPRLQRTRRRRGLLTGAVAVAVALTVAGTLWAAGALNPNPVVTPVDTEPTPRSSPTPAVVVPATVPEEVDTPVEAPAPEPAPAAPDDTKAEKAQEAAQKAAQKAADEQRKAEEDAQKKAEKAQERAEKEAETAQEEAEKANTEDADLED